jgi:hypothetical protein
MQAHGLAILLFGNDVHEEARPAYESWHAGHHVPQRLTVPGILGAIRFRAEGKGSPEYLTLYRLQDADVLESTDYRMLVENPDPPTLAMRHNLTALNRFVATVGPVPGIPAGFAMRAGHATRPYPMAQCQHEVQMTGPLIAGQRNHPIMKAALLPDGYLQLRFAPPDSLARLDADGAMPIGGLYLPVDRFGLDVRLLS